MKSLGALALLAAWEAPSEPVASAVSAGPAIPTVATIQSSASLEEATSNEGPRDSRRAWSAVGSMSLCVSMLIASEFMPVSLLTPIAADLHATEGMAGQAISISGLFAVVTSLLIPAAASRFDRRQVLLGLTTVMLGSLLLIAEASSFAMLMTARALLGVTIGGFWALSTATVMRLVRAAEVPKALGILYMGNAVATAIAAPVGSYLGSIIGWRGVFWALTPFVILNLTWQWFALPSFPRQKATSVRQVFRLLKRPNVAFGMAGVTLTFAGAFSAFTYFRPFLERVTQVSVPQLCNRPAQDVSRMVDARNEPCLRRSLRFVGGSPAIGEDGVDVAVRMV